jgi:hypothetical protein
MQLRLGCWQIQRLSQLILGRNSNAKTQSRMTSLFSISKEEKLKLTNRGVSDKGQLCSRILASGFSLEAAAAHPNCPSAKYFLDKLTALSSPKGT